MKAVVDERLPGPFGPYSHVVVDGDRVLTAGFGPHTDAGVPDAPEAQAHAALDNIERALAAVGCGLGDVVRFTVIVDDLQTMLPAVDAAFSARLPAPHPVRTVLQGMLPGGVPIVLDATARRRDGIHPDRTPTDEETR